MLDERSGCALLKRRFEEAGLHIVENQAFAEDGVAFELDGFDRDKRVGYEYVTSEAGDRVEVDHAVVAELEARMARGELYVLVIDELDAPDAELLELAATGFLDELRRRGVIA